MKVVAFKIFEKQDQLIRVLVKAGLYSSISEPLRQAGWELLRLIIEPLEYGDKLKAVTIPKDLINQFAGKTVSISGKFPIKMIEIIDCLVAQMGIYKNRSEYFREALTSFLVSDSELFSPFILKND